MKVGAVVLLVGAATGMSRMSRGNTHARVMTAADSSIVRQIDHIVLGTSDPTQLYALFADTLKLPVAWALARFGPVWSGGVSLGSINLEIGRVAERAGVSTPRFASIVFEPPPITEAIAELDARRIAHGPPNRYNLDNNSPAEEPAWTTVGVTALTTAPLNITLCDYVRPNTRDFRRLLSDSLRRRDGGPLGVIDADHVVVGTGGDSTLERTWRRFVSSDLSLARGPRLYLDSSAPRGNVTLFVRVRSLDRAESALTRLHVAARRESGALRVDPERLAHVDIRLVEGNTRE